MTDGDATHLIILLAGQVHRQALLPLRRHFNRLLRVPRSKEKFSLRKKIGFLVVKHLRSKALSSLRQVCPFVLLTLFGPLRVFFNDCYVDNIIPWSIREQT